MTDGNQEKNGDDALRTLNLSQVSFPSDIVRVDGTTIRSLRDRYPEEFDYGFSDSQIPQPKYYLDTSGVPLRRSHADIANLLHVEREIFAEAYSRECSQAMFGARNTLRASRIWEREEQAAEYYVALGIANGEQSAKLLIERIRQSAKELAISSNRGR